MKLLRGMDQEALTALVAARPDVAAQPEPRSLRPSPVVSPVAPGATRAVATTG